MKKTSLFLLVFVFIIFAFGSLSFAEDKLTIFISGQSHASLYPCNCPYNPEGGVARRATIIKQARKSGQGLLLLEAGGSFAGGNHDANTQTTELDKQRTKYYMQSLVQMGYDAFLVSSKELNFGDEFLSQAMSEYKLNYLSANLKGNFSPYLIKEVSGVKVAIIGITDDKVVEQTSSAFAKPEESLSRIIPELKNKKKADLVVVLSYLGVEESKDIIGRIEGVDIWVSSNSPFTSASNETIGQTLLVVPAWEARKLTKISLDLSSLAIEAIEHIELNADIKDDSAIASMIPACFTNRNCRKTGFISKCQNAATKKAKCEFSRIKPVKLTIIKPVDCKTCNIEAVIERIKQILPDLNIQYLEAESKSGQELIDKLNIKMLPAYLLDSSIEAEAASRISQIAKKVGNYYMLEPSLTGVSFIVGREKIANRLDLFFGIGSKDIVETLDVLQALRNKRKDIEIRLNFLAVEDPELGLIAKGEKYEIEEFLRSACINKYYPDKLYYYLSCRLADIGSSWWDDCLVKFDMDPGKIKGCARSQEGMLLLKDFIRLTQELEVVFGPTFLVNNQEIFSSEGAPTVEELERLFPAKVGTASGGK